MAAIFKGLGVAMISPFDANGDLDLEATQMLVEHLISGGVNFLVALGTTGEAVTQSDAEKVEFVKHVIKCNHGRVPVMVGVGGNCTARVIADLDKFSFAGIDGILSVTPFYNKPSQNGLLQHFSAVARHSKLPIVMYNVPGRTGVNMTAETTVRLASEHANIIGVKEASGNLTQMGHIVHNCPKGFAVLSGDDGLLLPQLAIGATGVISVVGNLLPKNMAQMIEAAQQNNYEKAREIHLNMLNIIELMFAEGNPAGIKAAMAILGIGKNVVRQPLATVSDNLNKRIELEMKRLQAIKQISN